MEFFVGVALALGVCGAASWLGMDRERVFYPTMMVTIASYYLAFALIDGRTPVLLAETALLALFTGVAVLGFKRNLWLVVGAIAGHGVMDAVHHHLVQNAGVPSSWPGFCLAFDVAAALSLALVLARRRTVVRPAERAAPGRPL